MAMLQLAFRLTGNSLFFRWSQAPPLALLAAIALILAEQTAKGLESTPDALFYALAKTRTQEAEGQFNAAYEQLLALRKVRPSPPPWLKKEIEYRCSVLSALAKSPDLQKQYAEMRTQEIFLDRARGNSAEVERAIGNLSQNVKELQEVDPAAPVRERVLVARAKLGLGDLENAITFGEQAVELVDEKLSRPNPLAALALCTVGNARRQLKRTKPACAALEAGREEFERCDLKNSKDYVEVLRHLAIATKQDQKFADAKKIFLESAEVARKLKFDKAATESRLYLQMSQSLDIFTASEALDWANRAEVAIRAEADKELLAVCHRCRAYCFQEMGEPVRAEAQFEEALSGFEELGHFELQSLVLLDLGNLYLEYDRFEEAARVLKVAEESAIRAGSHTVKVIRARRILAEASQGNGGVVERLNAEIKHEFPDTPGSKAFANESQLRLCLHAGNDERAVEHGLEAIRLLKQFGPSMPRVDEQFIQSETARALQRVGKPEAAVQIAGVALRGLDAQLKSGDPRAAYTSLKLLKIMKDSGIAVDLRAEDNARKCVDAKCRFKFSRIR